MMIGINHAGTSALRTLLKQNSDLDITAIDRSDNISFLGCGIALNFVLEKSKKECYVCKNKGFTPNSHLYKE